MEIVIETCLDSIKMLPFLFFCIFADRISGVLFRGNVGKIA